MQSFLKRPVKLWVQIPYVSGHAWQTSHQTKCPWRRIFPMDSILLYFRGSIYSMDPPPLAYHSLIFTILDVYTSGRLDSRGIQWQLVSDISSSVSLGWLSIQSSLNTKTNYHPQSNPFKVICWWIGYVAYISITAWMSIQMSQGFLVDTDF